jgi:MFS family permease
MFSKIQINQNLAVMSATILVNVLVINTWNPLLPLHLRALGANDSEIGLAFTFMTVARTLFAVVGGALADRFGRRLLLTLPHYAAAVLYLLAGVTGDWAALVAILVSTNALNALLNPAFNAIIAESAAEDRVARAYSATEIAVLCGLIIGPVIGAGLVTFASIPTLMIAYGVTLIFTTTVRFRGIIEPARASQARVAPKIRAALDSRIWWFTATYSMIAMAFGICFGPYFTILARDAWSSTESEINLLFALGNAASLFGVGFGRRADRWGAWRVLTLGMGVFMFSVVAWGVAPTWQTGLVPLLIAFLFSEGAFIALQTIQAQLTTRETRTSVMGIIATISGLIGGLGPALGAWLAAWGGSSTPFVACAVMSLIAIAASFGFSKNRREIPEKLAT